MKSADPTPNLVQRALAGHAAIGLLAGALLYIVILTGTLVVIHERWQRWERPAIAEVTVLAPSAVQHAITAGMRVSRPAEIHVQLPTDAYPRAVLWLDEKTYTLDAAGRIVGRDVHPWTDFVLALHEYLNLPTALGLILVGFLGVMWAALTVTGVIAHPRIFRDAYRLRARGNRQLAQADWHNRLGVWTLPFALAVALTGAFIGLASVGAGLIAKAYHGGDITRAYAPIFGMGGPVDARPAPLPNAAKALSELRAHFPRASPTYVTIEAPGTIGQRLTILADQPRRLIYGETYRFDFAGRLIDKVGLSDGALGQQAAASTYKLHFGSFGGLPVELAYLVLGLAGTIVCGTGTSLWLQKRSKRGVPSPRLEAMWTVVVWGSPALMIAVWWLGALGSVEAPLAGVFWSGLTLSLLAAAAAPTRIKAVQLRRLLAGMLAMAGVGHALLLGGPPAVLAIDCSLAAVAAALGLVDARAWRNAPRSRPRSAPACQSR